MKLFFLNTSSFVYGLSIFYFFAFYIFLILISKYVFKNKIKSYYLIFIIFALHYITVLLDGVFDFMPFFQDSNLYASLIRSISIPTGCSNRIIGFFYLTYIPKIFLFCQPLLFITFNIFLFILSIFIFFEIWDLMTDKEISKKFESLIWTCLLFLPSAYLFMSNMLRESFSLFSFSIFLYGLILFKYKSKIGFLILGFSLIILIRFQLVIFTFPMFVLTLLIKSIKKRKNILKVILILIFGVITFGIIFSLMGYKFTPEWFSYLRNFMIDYYKHTGFTYGSVEWNSYIDIILSAFPLGAQFLLSPLPIVKSFNPIQTFTMFVDSVYILIMLSVILIDIKRSFSKFKFLYIFIVFYILIVGLYEFHFPGATRHRFPIVILLTFLACDVINNKFIMSKE